MLFVVLAIACVVVAVGDILIGTTKLSLMEVWGVLCGSTADATLETIIFRMRIPKVVVATPDGHAGAQHPSGVR